MSVRAVLVAQLLRYHDETWIALANRGLLRRARKDLETTQVTVLEDDAVLRLQVGPWAFAFDARGPAHATCSCPSRSTCQHMITAGLWLTVQATLIEGDAAADRPGVGGQGRRPPDGQDRPLHDALMAMDPAVLTAHAGKTGYRLARQLVDDLNPERGVRVEAGQQVRIVFADPRVTFRYLGGGVESLVPDSRLPAVERYQVAAVLAYQRAHGTELAPVEPVVRRAAKTSGTLADSRARLRESATGLLMDTVRLGVSHLSAGVQEWYETLAVWAQGAEYHRLATTLRRLADHVKLLLDRSAGADEDRLLDEVAVAFALVSALEAAAGVGEALQHLVGLARNRYSSVRTMELIGLGGVPWRAASEYQGLTVLFWWPAESRFVSLTDARPKTLRGFDPRQHFLTSGPWSGLPSLAATTGARVRLRDAQLSTGGRLSGVERTHATLLPLSGDEITAVLPTVEVWSSLDWGHGTSASLLDTPDLLRDWVVLRPAGFGPAVFDPVTQALTWPVSDSSGAVLPLTVRYSPQSAHLIEQVERVAATGTVAGTLVVCRL